MCRKHLQNNKVVAHKLLEEIAIHKSLELTVKTNGRTGGRTEVNYFASRHFVSRKTQMFNISCEIYYWYTNLENCMGSLMFLLEDKIDRENLHAVQDLIFPLRRDAAAYSYISKA